MNATDGPDRNGSDLTQGRFHGQGSQALVEGIEVLCHPGAKETTHQQTWLFVPPTRSCLGIVYLLGSIYRATTMPILVYLQLICMLG